MDIINRPRVKNVLLIKPDLTDYQRDLSVHSFRICFENDRWHAIDIGKDLDPSGVARMLEYMARNIRKDIEAGEFGEDYADYYKRGGR